MDLPVLERTEREGVWVWTDPQLANAGVIVAFSERRGGVSDPPYASLNLAHHVGDDPQAVDTNRARLLASLGIASLNGRLVTAEQVHATRVEVVGVADAGRGASGTSAAPVAGTDALVSCEARLPLMLLFADCVPVVLVAPGPAIAVAHAGWRGALGRIPEKTVASLCDQARCRPSEVTAYIGAHICAETYEVSEEIMSQFVNSFVTVSRAAGRRLDLSLAVTESLLDAGVELCRIARLGVCTAQATDRFFSYRAEAGLTGRHAALACVL